MECPAYDNERRRLFEKRKPAESDGKYQRIMKDEENISNLHSRVQGRRFDKPEESEEENHT